MFCGLVFVVQDPWAREPDVDLDPSLLGKNICNCVYPRVCGLPAGGVGLDHRSPPLLPVSWFLLYIFSCRKSFLLVFRSFLIHNCSVNSCNFGMFIEGGELRVFFKLLPW